MSCKDCDNTSCVGDYLCPDEVKRLQQAELKLNKINGLVAKEFQRATEKFDAFHNTHEGYAILLEEVDELWDDIKANDLYSSCDEAIQVAAMAMRYLFDLMPDDFDRDMHRALTGKDRDK
ncbi:hypothetical protein LCGC14_0378000 [marine sediment metagenome]|uniref:Uncharacterized protein n=1 Tax=marine sediment metagenome TaxID=412755 RepID=A0A0F9TL94_9ZZZZ